MNTKKSMKKIVIASLAIVLGGGFFAQTVLESTPVYAEASTDAESVNVIHRGTVWKYLDDNTDPAKGLDTLTAWTLPSFDDSTWSSASGKFGAKRGELVEFDGFTPTVLLKQYYEGKKNTPTFFFRTEVDVQNVDAVTSLNALVYHDDDTAVYVNGNRIFSNINPNDENVSPENSNMYYAGHNGGAPLDSEIILNKEDCQKYLVEGKNVIAVEVHNDRESSSDVYFEFANMNINYNENEEILQKSVILNVGANESERNVTWYSNASKAGEVQYAKSSDGTFPETFTSVKATSTQSNDAGFNSNQATLSNLEADTQYVYRVVNDDVVSKTYTFKTGSLNNFSFLLAGDPQIGAGSKESDIEGWSQTLNIAMEKLKPDFMISAGDQVNTASNESQYEGYLNETLTSLPSASTIGNHDSGSIAYGQHFNLPNESEAYGKTTAGSDYWFVYNNTLFIDINSNNRSTAEHKAMIEEAIAKNPNVKWKTVIFHHSIYSTASHYDDSDIINRRAELPQMFDELDIDVVLMGHDHVYTRTYMMEDGFTPNRSEGVQNSVVDPEGILYLTANSASGSKYYDIKASDAEFAAVMDQSERRTITDVNVSDNAYTMTTYYADDMSVLDTFTIYKSADKDALKALIEEVEAYDKNEYTQASWNVFENALINAKEVLSNEKASQKDVDAAYTSLKDARDALKKKENIAAGDGDKGDINGTNQEDNGVETNDYTNVSALVVMMLSALSVVVGLKRSKNRV